MINKKVIYKGICPKIVNFYGIIKYSQSSFYVRGAIKLNLKKENN